MGFDHTAGASTCNCWRLDRVRLGCGWHWGHRSELVLHATWQVAAHGDLTVQGIHLTRGSTRGDGGAIGVAAGARAMRLENTTISDSDGSFGGGLNIFGRGLNVTLMNSSVVNCSTTKVGCAERWGEVLGELQEE